MAQLVKINSGHIMFALARHFDWFRNMMMPEWWIDGGIADLLFISRAGYATEIEIKISVSDWNADRDKVKWKADRPHIARFFYAIPSVIEDRIPEWVPPGVGIISVTMNRHGYAKVRTVREARRVKSRKIPPEEIAHMKDRCYFRFWHSEMEKRRKTLSELAGKDNS